MMFEYPLEAEDFGAELEAEIDRLCAEVVVEAEDHAASLAAFYDYLRDEGRL